MVDFEKENGRRSVSYSDEYLGAILLDPPSVHHSWLLQESDDASTQASLPGDDSPFGFPLWT